MDCLSRAQDKLIRSLYRRRVRREEGLCVCEGERACGELHALRPDLIRFGVVSGEVDVAGYPGVEFFLAPKEKFELLSSTVSPKGLILVAAIPKSPDASAPPLDPFALVLDRLTDPGNLGTILRTARAVGLKEVWHSAGTVDPFSEKTIRAAMAAQFALRLREFDSLDTLAAALRGFGVEKFFRAEPAGGLSCFEAVDLFERSAVVFGNEAFGAAALAGATQLHIPMPGDAESLNVAQAATVILFEAVRRRVLA